MLPLGAPFHFGNQGFPLPQKLITIQHLIPLVEKDGILVTLNFLDNSGKFIFMISLQSSGNGFLQLFKNLQKVASSLQGKSPQLQALQSRKIRGRSEPAPTIPLVGCSVHRMMDWMIYFFHSPLYLALINILPQ